MSRAGPGGQGRQSAVLGSSDPRARRDSGSSELMLAAPVKLDERNRIGIEIDTRYFAVVDGRLTLKASVAQALGI